MADYDHLLFNALRPHVPPRRAEGNGPLLPGTPAVFHYRLVDQPDAWLYMVARSGTDLETARDRLVGRFGDRVLEVRVRG